MPIGRFSHAFLALVLTAGPLAFSQGAAPTDPAPGAVPRHPIMHLDQVAMERRKFAYENAPRMEINPSVQYMLRRARNAGARASASLLSYLAYTPSTWNQGNCGNCWVWASTAEASISMAVNGKKDLLSVQYFNSGYNNGTGSDWAGCGGFVEDFANWHGSHRQFIPISNPNAAYADGNNPSCPGTTRMPFSSIGTSPNYPFLSITNKVVPTLNTDQATAISNIKSVLNQNKAVMFGFYLPTDASWADFDSFWSNNAESSLYQMDKYNGKTWEDNGGGGHEVIIVGYDDSDGSWITLNSWGTTSRRPNGLFRMPQTLNYDTYFVYNGSRYHSFDFEVFDIAWPSSSNTVSASITNPGSDITIGTGTDQGFSGTATDSSSTATLTYSWNFGDGGTATGASTSHTFTNTSSVPVTYTVTFTATDDTGAKGTDTRRVTVNPGTNPGNTVTASISIPSSDVTIPSGTTQDFSGSATDSDPSAALSYSWSFGDGGTASGATARHAYTNTGSSPVAFLATLTATDGTGAKGTATRTITVEPAGSGQEAVVNGGFENGSAGWQASWGSIGSFAQQPAYEGSRCVWLCGYGRSATGTLSQRLTVPGSATLSFALHIDTAERTSTRAYDRLTVSLKNTRGRTLRNLGTFSNLDAASGYSLRSCDLSAFRGQTVVLEFKGTEDRTLQTSFVIDNVSLVGR